MNIKFFVESIDQKARGISSIDVQNDELFNILTITASDGSILEVINEDENFIDETTGDIVVANTIVLQDRKNISHEASQLYNEIHADFIAYKKSNGID